MRLTTRSCRLGGIISARMKRWPLSGSTVGCVIGLPAFGDGPAWCRKRSRWSMPPSRCLPPTTLMEQRQNSPCHCLLNTLLFGLVHKVEDVRGVFTGMSPVQARQGLNRLNTGQPLVNIHTAQQRLVEAGLKLVGDQQDPILIRGECF